MKPFPLALGCLMLVDAALAELQITELMASNTTAYPDITDLEDYPDWIEIHNPTAVDVSLDNYHLSDDPAELRKWSFSPGFSMGPGEYLVVIADGHGYAKDTRLERPYYPENSYTTKKHHTSFSLSSEGESVILSREAPPAADPLVVDTISFSQQVSDISYGRDPAAPASWVHFVESTPGAPNVGPLVSDIRSTSGEVTASHLGGFHASSFSLTLSSAGSPIHYTTDGSLPKLSSPVYSGAISVSGVTTLRARSFEAGKVPGPPLTRTYLIGASPYDLPILSVVADPATLFDSEIGIYSNSIEIAYKGKDAPGHLEFFPADDSSGFA